MIQKPILTAAAIMLIFAALATACSPAGSPADVIANYLEALAENDQASAISNSCAAWEEKAVSEAASFVNVEVTLENLDCQVLDQSGEEATVTCTGRFLFSYDAGEEQQLALSGRVFTLVVEGGDWRMCGYQK